MHSTGQSVLEVIGNSAERIDRSQWLPTSRRQRQRDLHPWGKLGWITEIVAGCLERL